MAKREKLVSPNGGTEIEVSADDRAYYISIGYTEKSNKPTSKKSKEIK
jgi:hypothetical protein|tara:strand:- start:161 stop:304 length:144 start_codon:yes stop_codon:yes gene_type:complete